MSRWIDADRLTRKLNDAIWVGEKADMPTGELEAVLNDVLSAPSIDIVRCADCKYSGAWFGHTMKCKKFHQLFDESFYCAFGEWVEE